LPEQVEKYYRQRTVEDLLAEAGVVALNGRIDFDPYKESQAAIEVPSLTELRDAHYDPRGGGGRRSIAS
jgi:hypothetical protein